MLSQEEQSDCTVCIQESIIFVTKNNFFAYINVHCMGYTIHMMYFVSKRTVKRVLLFHISFRIRNRHYKKVTKWWSGQRPS